MICGLFISRNMYMFFVDSRVVENSRNSKGLIVIEASIPRYDGKEDWGGGSF